jgi:hypothetical protein
MYDPPGYLWALTLVGVIGIPALTCVVLYRGAQRADLGRGRAALLGGAAVVVLGGWLAVSAAIAGAGSYHTQLGNQPPWLPIAAIGALIALLAASRLPAVTRALSVSDAPSRLLLPHTFRVAGLAFLITMVLGHLPALFALPAGLGDIAVGIAAPFVARRLARGTGRRSALWFNALGIVDLVVALSLGGLTGYQIIQVTPASDAISELPLALIPTATVPLLLALHVVSVLQLVRVSRTTRRAPDTARTPLPGNQFS